MAAAQQRQMLSIEVAEIENSESRSSDSNQETLNSPSTPKVIADDWRKKIASSFINFRVNRKGSVQLNTAKLNYSFAVVLSPKTNDVSLPGNSPDSDANDGITADTRQILKRMCFSGLLPHVETKVISRGLLKVIILIQAPDNVLLEEWKQHQLETWVEYGHHDEFFAENCDKTLTPAERIFLVNRILYKKVEHGGIGLDSYADTVERAFPLHDENFNREALTKWWCKWTDYFRNNDDWIQSIRRHFGEKTALYFAFMDYYTKWLIPLTVLGILVHFLSYLSLMRYYQACAILGMLICSFWGPLFLVFWNRHQNYLAMRWGLSPGDKEEEENKKFRGIPKCNQDTGRVEILYPFYKRFFTYCVGGIILVVLVVMEIFMTAAFVDMYFFVKSGCGGGCARDGLENWLLVLCQGILLGLSVDIIQYQVFRAVTSILTDYENHRTIKRYENSRAVKVFIWDFCGIYSWFWMCAFIYIPYGEEFSSWLHSADILPWKSYYAEGSVDLAEIFITPLIVTQALKILAEKILPYYLKLTAQNVSETSAAQCYAVYLEAQAISNATKTIVTKSIPNGVRRALIDSWYPGPQRLPRSNSENKNKAVKPIVINSQSRNVQQELARCTSSPASKTMSLFPQESELESDHEQQKLFEEKRNAYLSRILEQSQQEPHDTLADYADQCVQFGYVNQFSCVWPFIPLCALVNNLFEIRSSAFQLAYAKSRPIPRKSKTVGVWKQCLRFNNLWSIFINLGLICYSSGLLEWFQMECEHLPTRESLSDRLPPLKPIEGCVTASDRFFSFLAGEHLLLLINFLVTMWSRSLPKWIKMNRKLTDQQVRAKYVDEIREHYKQELRTRYASEDTQQRYSVLKTDLSAKLAHAQRVVRLRLAKTPNKYKAS